MKEEYELVGNCREVEEEVAKEEEEKRWFDTDPRDP